MTRGSRPWRGLEWFEAQAIHVWLAVGYPVSDVARGMRVHPASVQHHAENDTRAKLDAMARGCMHQHPEAVAAKPAATGG